jgi:DnaK suppressor protein
MAKAQKTSDKKTTSKAGREPAKKLAPRAKSEPAKAKEHAKPATKPAAGKEPPRAAAAAPRETNESPRKEPLRNAPKPNPEASQVRAHPDAKLTKAETHTLFQKLIEEKNRVLGNFERHVDDALSDEDILADEIDLAQRSTDQAWLFRMADKDRKLLIEIDAALEKMRSGEYGLCEGTDEPIGFKRLELRPWTRYSVAYKEMLEREKAQQAR